MKCRFCGAQLQDVFIDLVNSPPSNSFLREDQLNMPEVYYPLKVFTCTECFLVQIDEYKSSTEIFDNNYAYFSSYSKSWLEHSKQYVDMMIERFNIDTNSHVMEVASNDGYLLQYFHEKNIPVLGIEPSGNTADVAEKKGIKTIRKFFGAALAHKLKADGISPDVINAINVLAHVPDLNDFVEGFKIVLAEKGVITVEFPHILQLIDNNQFDTIYHEHFSYFSFLTVQKLFKKHKLTIFDVTELPTHGGSLRIFARHEDNDSLAVSDNVHALLDKEIKKKMNTPEFYRGFQENSAKIKYDLVTFLMEQKRKNITVAAYGAAAKGNTLINYCGIKKDLISFVVDRSPYKQNKYLPGSHIKVVPEEVIKKEKPEIILILPWNLKDEIINQLSYAREWGAKFVVPIPELEIL